MLLFVTDRIINTQVKHNKREKGESGYGLVSLIKIFVNYVINDSTLPLKFLSSLGLFNFLISFVLILFYLIKYLNGDILIPGWITTIILLLFFNGLVLFSFGLVGEYLLKILNQSKKLPKYIIRR